MAILRDNTIDTANIKPEDKVLKNITGSTMSFQIDGGASLSLQGAHANFDSEQFYAIALVNMTTLETTATASTPGLYLAIVEGVDEAHLEISGSGIIHWKELGD